MHCQNRNKIAFLEDKEGRTLSIGRVYGACGRGQGNGTVAYTKEHSESHSEQQEGGSRHDEMERPRVYQFGDMPISGEGSAHKRQQSKAAPFKDRTFA